MSSVKIIILCESTFTDFSDEKVQILEDNNIPYFISDDQLYFIDDYEKEIDTREIGEHGFLYSLFSGIPEYNLGDFKLPSKDKLKVLIDVFESIDLDLSVSDSNSGESDRVNFKMGSDLKIWYKFERKD
jgi:hypothetical protein